MLCHHFPLRCSCDRALAVTLDRASQLPGSPHEIASFSYSNALSRTALSQSVRVILITRMTFKASTRLWAWEHLYNRVEKTTHWEDDYAASSFTQGLSEQGPERGSSGNDRTGHSDPTLHSALRIRGFTLRRSGASCSHSGSMAEAFRQHAWGFDGKHGIEYSHLTGSRLTSAIFDDALKCTLSRDARACLLFKLWAQKSGRLLPLRNEITTLLCYTEFAFHCPPLVLYSSVSVQTWLSFTKFPGTQTMERKIVRGSSRTSTRWHAQGGFRYARQIQWHSFFLIASQHHRWPHAV